MFEEEETGILSITDPDTEAEQWEEPREAKGEVAIVTGGSSGIGRAVAFVLAEQGVHIAFNYLDDGSPRTRREAQRVAEELQALGVDVLCRVCDVRRSADVNRFVEETVAMLGGVHILVNNAGIGRDRALWRMTDEEWQSVMQTNVDGAFFFTRAVAPHFRIQEHGKIVNITSVHAFKSEFGVANYGASKAALVALTRSSALELGDANVNVNAVAPGYIRTTRLTEGVPPEVLDAARVRSALGRLGDPQDVAGVVMFLVSEAARHITGAVIPVDAGYRL